MLTPGTLNVYHLRSGVWQRYNTPIAGGTQLWVGATVTNDAADSDIANFKTSNSIIGPLRLRRTFVPPKTVATFPTDIAQTPAGDDIAAGLRPFLSCKADPAAIINGDFDGVITQLLQSFPTTGPAWFTMWHEPEDDMAGNTFVQMFQHMYTVAKAANPNVLIGPIHMAYQWRGGNAPTATPDDWWVGSSYCDFLALDTYWDTWRGTTAQPIQNDPWAQRWHSWASAKGKPLYITERGAMPLGAASASVLLQDETWLKANGYQMFLYWDAVGTSGTNYRIDGDADMSGAWQQIASRGRTS